ncbi:helix-turn-helix transcriptional regulator [Donghicola sp. C2-DW-16]|uniref:Helix-turn-helix transcriptional regulator n=2 Tax=Donghicola mangrovi TaxID=2729614 RepID=A0ABX2PCU4_9RHOB|nr:helix-turn-helix transcriptional regulator [Donghicola mangrovi]
MCLDLLGCGLRTKAIAQELGISVVTVELHLRNARTKLGAATRDQALMLYRAKTAS